MDSGIWGSYKTPRGQEEDQDGSVGPLDTEELTAGWLEGGVNVTVPLDYCQPEFTEETNGKCTHA
jgi:hypothetical protein